MSPPRPRRRRSRPLEDTSNAIYRALCDAGLSDQARRLRLFQRWREAVGPEIAARTSPQMFRKGVLMVKAASPTWQNELVYLKTSIVARLNEILGKNVVRDLKIISGIIPPTEVSGLAPNAVAAPRPRAEDVASAQKLAAAIPDSEVRAAFARLVAKDHCARSLRGGKP